MGTNGRISQSKVGSGWPDKFIIMSSPLFLQPVKTQGTRWQEKNQFCWQQASGYKVEDLHPCSILPVTYGAKACYSGESNCSNSHLGVAKVITSSSNSLGMFVSSSHWVPELSDPKERILIGKPHDWHSGTGSLMLPPILLGKGWLYWLIIWRMRQNKRNRKHTSAGNQDELIHCLQKVHVFFRDLSTLLLYV